MNPLPALQRGRPWRAHTARRSAGVFAILTVLLAVLAGCATVTPPDAPATTEPAAAQVAAPEPAVTATAATAAPPPLPTAAAPADPAASGAAATRTARRAPRPRLDPLADAARGDLWARVREAYAMPDLDSELVRKWEQYYAQRPDYVQRMTARGARYLWHIVEELERRDMPGDLALLPFIESAFDPQALSVARAAGMWQFMPGTGRDFELKQNLFRDDRRDILASTRAALDYLQRLHEMFGDWHLALAAYNWGQGNVQRAIVRNARAGRPTGYEDLRMPEETRNYVPKLQAIKNIVSRPGDFELVLPPLEDHPYFTTVDIERDIDAELAAQFAGLTPEQFRQLNPQHNKPVILAAGTPQILLPYDNANRFVRALRTHRGPLASWTAWVAPRTVRPREAARQVGMTEDELREVNRIPARMLVKAGSTLLVPRSAKHEDVSEEVADSARIALAPESRPGRRLQVKVRGRKSVSVTALARRHGMTPKALAAANGVSVGSSFRPGQLVTVLLPARSKVRSGPRHKVQQASASAARKTHAAAKKPAKRAAKPAASARLATR
jgi:membrane-bound lytic murein transglycosylase D